MDPRLVLHLGEATPGDPPPPPGETHPATHADNIQVSSDARGLWSLMLFGWLFGGEQPKGISRNTRMCPRGNLGCGFPIPPQLKLGNRPIHGPETLADQSPWIMGWPRVWAWRVEMRARDDGSFRSDCECRPPKEEGRVRELALGSAVFPLDRTCGVASRSPSRILGWRSSTRNPTTLVLTTMPQMQPAGWTPECTREGL